MQICMELNDHLQQALETVRERAAQEWGDEPNKIIGGQFARTCPDEIIIKLCILSLARECREAMAKEVK